MAWLCTLRALLPRPLRNWKLVNATAQLPASASQHNTTAQDFTSHAHPACLPSDALSPADQIMPPWIVLVDCRASGHIWKSRQYKGNALGVLSTSLPRSRHVVATWRYSFAVISKSCAKGFFGWVRALFMDTEPSRTGLLRRAPKGRPTRTPPRSHDVPQWAGRPHRPRIVSRPFSC